jgi:hypothetical protein
MNPLNAHIGTVHARRWSDSAATVRADAITQALAAQQRRSLLLRLAAWLQLRSPARVRPNV